MNKLLLRYALNVTEHDTQSMLSYWSWLAPLFLKPILITKFGDWFLADHSSNVFFMDLLEGTLCPLAANEEDFIDPDFINRFKSELSVDWTEVCLSQGMLLQPGQCYGWKVHPILGGALDSSNIKSFSLNVYQTITSQLHQQLRSQSVGMNVTGFAAMHPPGNGGATV